MKFFHKCIHSVVRWITPIEDVFLAFERYDAEITARDNKLNKENENADNTRNEWGYPVVLPTSGTEGCIGDSQSNLHLLQTVIRERSN